ncbi:hypothetical protein [uncultured Streptomyces sp.]|uniref:hypothetical protein n=1 Tax=uncultured Streptomyces sp. TaxID=174707 RepID=UPI002633F558|nr:hypothetical protein [uncultured Streptomyces sp.]
MARTQHRTTAAQDRRSATMRRALRREAAGTVGLLADPADFAAMRRYRTFTFDDHTAYLRQIEAVLRSLAAEGAHTTVALFDPKEYAEFCADHAIDPDSPAARSRFTAELARTGATVAYAGQPIAHLVPQLVSRAVRNATRDYATMLLAELGACADCGQDIGRAAFDRASHLLLRLLQGAGPGTHHLVCSTPARDDHLLAVLHTEQAAPPTEPDAPGPPTVLSPDHATEFATVLAVGVALDSRGGVVLRSMLPGAPDRVHGWRLVGGSLVPLTEAEVFAAYCTDADTGDPLAPEPGVQYRAGFDLGADEPEPHR